MFLERVPIQAKTGGERGKHTGMRSRSSVRVDHVVARRGVRVEGEVKQLFREAFLIFRETVCHDDDADGAYYSIRKAPMLLGFYFRLKRWTPLFQK